LRSLLAIRPESLPHRSALALLDAVWLAPAVIEAQACPYGRALDSCAIFWA